MTANANPNWKASTLIVTGGFAPAVVTEAVFGLWMRRAAPLPSGSAAAPAGSDRFAPTRIICVVTGDAEARYREPLARQLDLMCSEWGIPNTWGEHQVRVPKYRDRFLADIRTFEDGVAYGDAIEELVWDETQSPEGRLHVCLSGGRKTMSAYAQAAISHWGRTQDELSHVLVGLTEAASRDKPDLSPIDFETCPDFWFPARESRILKARGDREIDAADAVIDMADVPFLPVRQLLIAARLGRPMGLEQTNLKFREQIAGKQMLTFGRASRQVKIGDSLEFELDPQEFAFYRLLAEWSRDQVPGAGPHGVGPDHRGWLTRSMFAAPHKYRPNPIQRYLDIYEEDTRGRDVLKTRLYPVPDENQKKTNMSFYSARLSNLRKKLPPAMKLSASLSGFFPEFRTVKHRLGKVTVTGLMIASSDLRIDE